MTNCRTQSSVAPRRCLGTSVTGTPDGSHTASVPIPDSSRPKRIISSVGPQHFTGQLHIPILSVPAPTRKYHTGSSGSHAPWAAAQGGGGGEV